MLNLKALPHSFRWPRLIRLLIIISVFLFAFGLIIHMMEPETFPSLFEGIWWAIVTMSTVGFGDYVPQTAAGKWIGIILILSGAGLITSYFASIAKLSISAEQQFMTGSKAFTGEEHIIIVGWNERSRLIIEEIHDKHHQQPIILIDDSLKNHPLPRTNIHFVHGKATDDATLLKANINQAALILITADLNQDEFRTDMFSILSLLAVKGMHPEITCLVEILTGNQRENARRAGADHIIETNAFASYYMMNLLLSKLDHGAEASFHGLFITPAEPDENQKGLTFSEAAKECINQGKLLIGISRKGKNLIKPDGNTILQSSDTLLFINENS
ncbi:potassium channel family protein [Bacillus massiliglaciei]|uniref:potassium channel family protein n=1 Tax=Bacillus massiliglaciei TaxID=1816693 RepID=UPI000DA62117|nr:potassium channel family protein [Bacillus massiliglaciei]